MLAVAANGHLDLTRSLIDQLVVKLALTVTVGHTRPVNGSTNLLIHGAATLTLIIPAVLGNVGGLREPEAGYQAFRDGGTCCEARRGCDSSLQNVLSLIDVM